MNQEGNTTSRVIKTAERREKKVMVKDYAHSNAKDAEHFFQAFEVLQAFRQNLGTQTDKHARA